MQCHVLAGCIFFLNKRISILLCTQVVKSVCDPVVSCMSSSFFHFFFFFGGGGGPNTQHVFVSGQDPSISSF